jgi:hypothetical protein
MQTIVIRNVHREPLVAPFLDEFSPVYSYCDDRPGIACGQTRCIAGHQTALAAYMTDETALVIEDDCVPNANLDWRGAIKEANDLVLSGRCEVACLHGRGEEEIPKKFRFKRYKNFNWAVPPKEHYSIQGTLIYVCNKAAAWKFRQFDPWIRYSPIDAIWWSPNFDWMLLEDKWTTSPFSWTPRFFHGHGAQGSILENPRNKEYSRV